MTAKTYSQDNQWSWLKGDNIQATNDNSLPVYGTLGIPDADNRPGSREGATNWKDASGNLWLYGGIGNGISGNGLLNDLWKYNISTSQWTWVNGDQTINKPGVYGTINVAVSQNKPGSRSGAIVWTDASGDFWMLGGNGYGSTTTPGGLNDLWKYNPSTNIWVWVKGDKTINSAGVYGTIGIPNSANKPGARYNGGGWVDGSGNFWLFGGKGQGTTTTIGRLNDLWRFNPSTSQWTWIKGDQTLNNVGVYGTKNTASAANKPGGREKFTAWKDAGGNFWLFGGEGYHTSAGNAGYLGDLWRYNPTNSQWTWVRGSNTFQPEGIYGTMGIPANLNEPGGRYSAAGFVDTGGSFWLFGGNGLGDFYSSPGTLNDFWKYNPATNQWTWMNGSKSSRSTGSYGTQGIASSNNTPGAKENTFAWTDASGNFWLFGGNGPRRNYSTGILNELWKYNVETNAWAWLSGVDWVEVYTPGDYGTQGLEAVTNNPGGRSGASEWTDSSGKCWLFGGAGGGVNGSGWLNDLWKYDPSSNRWTWIRGDKTVNNSGVYGVKGVSAATNKPGGRNDACTWKDDLGNFWLFGGYGYSSSKQQGNLNDLWMFNPVTNEWIWVMGDSTADNVGNYGIQGAPGVSNQPGSRSGACSWKDPGGDFWLFGGSGYGSSTTSGVLNDLWKYNSLSNVWTWVKGDSTTGNSGVYGNLGISNSINKPGARANAISWTDSSGNLWLYGGYKIEYLGENSRSADYNDLWTYKPTTNAWTWMNGNGDYTMDLPVVYGTQGIPSMSNTPGGRSASVGWSDSTGNLWLFGGYSANGSLNDLWKYNTVFNQWSWIKGDNSNEQGGYYGEQNIPDPANKPGSRSSAAAWSNGVNGFWLFGGYGFGPSSTAAYLNDLWKYNLPCPGLITINPLTSIVPFTGNPITLTASGGASYEWHKDGIFIPGATGASFIAASPGVYNVKGVVGTCADIYSNEIVLSSAPVPPGLGGNGIYGVGDPVNVGIPETEVEQDYRWLQNGSAVYYYPKGGNGGNQSLNFSMTADRAGSYIVESSKPGWDAVYSNTVFVGFAAITGLVASWVCSETVSFGWNRVVPQNIPQSYQYSVSLSPTPPTNGSTTSSNFQSQASLNPSTTYYIHVRSAYGFDLSSFGDWKTISFTTASTPLPPGTAEWTGAFDTNWNNTANWKCGEVPFNTTTVIINGGKPNYPLIKSNKTVKSISVNAGATLEVSPGVTLTVTGL